MTDQPDSRTVSPPGKFPPSDPDPGIAPKNCQSCGSSRLDFEHYGLNYAWCEDCTKMSVPVSAQACWNAIMLIRGMGENFRNWDPLAMAIGLLQDGVKDLGRTSHEEQLAIRARKRVYGDPKAAIAILQVWMNEVSR